MHSMVLVCVHYYVRKHMPCTAVDQDYSIMHYVPLDSYPSKAHHYNPFLRETGVVIGNMLGVDQKEGKEVLDEICEP